jgi:hypothetical protein
MEYESANSAAVAMNRRSDAASNSRCRQRNVSMASPCTAKGTVPPAGLTAACRLRFYEAMSSVGAAVPVSPARKRSHKT